LSSKSFFAIIKKVYLRFVKDEVSFLAAQVSYYLILSFFPFLIFLITLISYTNLITLESIEMLSALLPESVFNIIVELAEGVLAARNKAYLSLGAMTTIWSGSLGVLAFMQGMNKTYRKKETRPFWKVRALSVFFTLALSVILVFSIVLIVFGEILGRHLFAALNISPSFNVVWDAFRYIAAFLTLVLVLMLFYAYIPNCSIKLKEVIPGTIFAASGWLLLSAGFAYYVNNFANYSKIYGSIGAAIALLIWLYWSCIIVFLGSEINAILYNHKCS